MAALGPAVVQSVLTGNVPAMARAKLAAFGLGAHLDLDVGAYGDHHEVRAELVHLARGRACAAYGREFGGQATVLVGDTPLDVEAALATGARAVGVATGGPTAAELAAAGADVVLPDLTDTAAAVAAIVGAAAPSPDPPDGRSGADREVPLAGQHRPQLGRLGGDHGVRARSVAPADRDQPDAPTGDLPPDPEAGEILLQIGQLPLAAAMIFTVAHGMAPGRGGVPR